MSSLKGSVIISDNDKAIFTFLWAWKIATTRNLALRFYRDKSFRAAYMRLWRLERAGLIESTSTPDRKNHLWTLSQRGFKSFIVPYNHYLKAEGYKSENIDHDLFVNAVHLGDWLIEKPSGVELYTEQQLRRVDPEFFPSWIPKSKLHRPDGYTRIQSSNGLRLLAIEIEISPKRSEEYENYGRFYAEDTLVSEVVWVVSGQALARRINERIRKAVAERGDIHSFFLLSDIKSNGWNSVSIIGKSQNKRLCEIYEKSPESCRNDISGVHFFDTRKSLVKSERSKNLAIKKSPVNRRDIG